MHSASKISYKNFQFTIIANLCMPYFRGRLHKLLIYNTQLICIHLILKIRCKNFQFIMIIVLNAHIIGYFITNINNKFNNIIYN